ncbi:SirB1 family protein [Pseudonocardia sp. N23]|uniref:SirB1 family protein n=1 Tax=Pseudonocardia sp. N23 TaxID=1987376 RepID=UPI000BFC6B17|nr:transglutaminase-like domain-containing protein [Pseudonocardia sp. N23]GAY08773.1 protein sirB1 [Pseudonocardia sp. N23]
MDPVARFGALVGRGEPDLDVGALAIAAGAHPGLDPDRWIAELDRLAAAVPADSGLSGLLELLFEVEGFRGNTEDYYDPRNSLLPHVLKRRTGIPITLAVVAIEVGRRVGVELQGVGMPGHFLVRDTASGAHVDVFAGGRLLDDTDCEQLFRAATGADRSVEFTTDLLPRVNNRQILIRMLQNLRGVYARRRRPVDLEWVLRMQLTVPGPAETAVPLLTELAGALGEQARWPEAARILRKAAEDPDAPLDAQQRDALRDTARSQLANLN